MHNRRRSQLHTQGAFRHDAKPQPKQQRNIPDDLLDRQFKNMVARTFGNMIPGSKPYLCIQRAWYNGVLFMQGINLTISRLQSNDALTVLDVVERQTRTYFEREDEQADEQPTADSGADSGTNSTATDNPGEQDPGEQEQRGGEDQSGTRDA